MLEFKPAVNKNLIERVIEYYKLSSEEQIPYVVIEKNLLREFLMEINKFVESDVHYKLAITALDDVTDVFSYQVVGINNEYDVTYKSDAYPVRNYETIQILSDICSEFIENDLFTTYQCTAALYNLLKEDIIQDFSSADNENFTLIKKAINSILHTSFINARYKSSYMENKLFTGFNFSIDETNPTYWEIHFDDLAEKDVFSFKVNTIDVNFFLADICRLINKLNLNEGLSSYADDVIKSIRKFLAVIKHDYIGNFLSDGFEFPGEVFIVFDVLSL